jgi:hypothetical protein
MLNNIAVFHEVLILSLGRLSAWDTRVLTTLQSAIANLFLLILQKAVVLARHGICVMFIPLLEPLFAIIHN